MAIEQARFERLSALDASFLGLEEGGTHMHVGAVAVFEPGGMDVTMLREYIERRLDAVPRYRQRVIETPVLGHPVWIDHRQFDVREHVHAAHLGPGADDAALFELAGAIFSVPLDRRRPPWQLWVASGLSGGRFALVFKVHHCVLDGVAGAGLLEALLTGTADPAMPEPTRWHPRPEPGALDLLGAELSHRARSARRLIGDAVARAREPAASKWALRGAREMIEALRTGLGSAPDTPWNPRAIGLERSFAGRRFDLDDVKAVKNCLGGTVNDVVLATTAGAVRRSLSREGVDPSRLAGFRAMIPMNIRRPGHQSLGNHVGMGLAELPIAEARPGRRYELIRRATAYLKSESGQARSSELIETVSDAVSPGLVLDMVRLAVARRSYNLVVTNVAGPPFPLYLLGSRLASVYPLVPLYRNQVVGLALFSYAGGLYWGAHADAETMPHLEPLLDDLGEAFAELQALAGARAGARPAGPIDRTDRFGAPATLH